MDLVELYIDKQFNYGDIVYHKPTGMVGKYRMDAWIDDKVSVEIMGHGNLFLTHPRDLTHKLPRFAKLKHIYNHATKWIFIVVYLISSFALVACAMTGVWYYSLPGFSMVMIFALGLQFDRFKAWMFRHPGFLLICGACCIAMFCAAVRYNILYK
jgi:hypothetical protein